MEKNVGSVERDIIFLFGMRGPPTIITCIRSKGEASPSNSNKNEGEQLNDTSTRNEREKEREGNV